MFFEQNLLEPNVGTARFWRLTGRDGERPEAFARHLEAGAAALAALERGLAGKEFLVGGRYTVADCALYALHARRARGGVRHGRVSGRRAPGSSASRRRRARSTTSSRTRLRRTRGRVGGRRTTRAGETRG